ncbi:MAG: DUF962 domain-containing protein [Deltaproteobacteria bacterium]|nr:DUF962 domain-containing protein [Deltaproteobacteria bacterium]
MNLTSESYCGQVNFMEPTRTRVPSQGRAVRTRAALVEAAAREFAASGYAATTARSIAERAQAATGSFYQYFTSKDEVLRELAAARQDDLIGRALAPVETVAPGSLAIHDMRAYLRAVIEIVVAYHADDARLHAVITERRHADPALDELIAHHRGRAPLARAHHRRARALGPRRRSHRNRVHPARHARGRRARPRPRAPRDRRPPLHRCAGGGPPPHRAANRARIQGDDMALVQLNAEWSELMDRYQADHQHPVNQACHSIGIPLIAASLPIGATLIGLPLAIPMFTVGWTFQFVGHAFEGKKPSFVDDKRQLLTGLMWWTQKVGLGLVARAAPTT